MIKQSSSRICAHAGSASDSPARVCYFDPQYLCTTRYTTTTSSSRLDQSVPLVFPSKSPSNARFVSSELSDVGSLGRDDAGGLSGTDRGRL